MGPMFSDAHNHLLDPRLGDPGPLITAMREAGVRRCVVNSTCEEEWADLEALAAAHPDFVIPAYGVHPWKAHLVEAGWSDRLHELLDRSHRAVVGECGLDRWVDSPGVDIQAPVFEAQLRLAREFDRPAVIHCLKAWQALFDSFERVPPPRRFLLHSFNGSLETARRLLPMGAFFSFSGYFLHPRKAEVAATFLQLPQNRVLMETDAPDMLPPGAFITHPLDGRLNHPANLGAIAAGFAATAERGTADLAETTEGAFETLFGG